MATSPQQSQQTTTPTLATSSPLFGGESKNEHTRNVGYVYTEKLATHNYGK